MTITGERDDNGNHILVGDILLSKDGYTVLVCLDNDRGYGFYGSLICPIGDSCRDIPYAFNHGHGYVIISRPSMQTSFTGKPTSSTWGEK